MNKNTPRPIYLVDDRAKRKALKQLEAEPVDGTRKVTFSGAKDKSTRQRGLQWIWYGDVTKSGIGGADEATENLVHRKSKAVWCLPILIRDDDNFADLWLQFYRRWQNTSEWEAKFEWFIDHHVSTEKLNQAQMAEYLTKFRDHYGFDLGVELTDPDERGWKNLLETNHENRI